MVGPERFELCRLDVVRVHDPTIISRVLLGVASCNITVLSYGPTGFFAVERSVRIGVLPGMTERPRVQIPPGPPR